MTALAAIQAYTAAQTSAASLAGGAGATAVNEAGFGEMLSQVLSETISSTRAAETQIANQVAGKAELIDVVTAISSAEASLETVMAIRDQVIQAYQEILRMPI